MKPAPVLLLVVVAGAAGWFGRGLADGPEKQARAPMRVPPDVQQELAEAKEGRRLAEEAVETLQTRLDAANRSLDTVVPEANEVRQEAEATAASKPGLDPIVEMVEAQRPQWKAWASMAVKQRVDGLFDDLGLTPEAAALVEQKFLEDVDRQVDHIMGMMLGEEDLDPKRFDVFLGVSEELSTELSGELGTFLSDEEIFAVRSRVRENYDKQLKDMADVHINMMDLPQLSDDQQTRLQGIFTEKNQMREQLTQFAQATRNRDQLKGMLEDPGQLRAVMEKQFEPTRAQVREILTPQQFAAYQKFEETQYKQAEMGLRMMKAMYKAEPESPKPAGK